MSDTPLIYDAAIEILSSTRDGDDLNPIDLKLVETAVNGWLTEQGEIAFYDLLKRVRKGYSPPWFHGIEHLTIDHEGYVYWKDREVEHYDFPWAYSNEGKLSAEELAGRCRHLETVGVPVNTTNVIWHWDKYKGRAEKPLDPET